jgi:hypothetical protein
MGTKVVSSQRAGSGEIVAGTAKTRWSIREDSMQNEWDEKGRCVEPSGLLEEKE